MSLSTLYENNIKTLRLIADASKAKNEIAHAATLGSLSTMVTFLNVDQSENNTHGNSSAHSANDLYPQSLRFLLIMDTVILSYLPRENSRAVVSILVGQDSTSVKSSHSDLDFPDGSPRLCSTAIYPDPSSKYSTDLYEKRFFDLCLPLREQEEEDFHRKLVVKDIKFLPMYAFPDTLVEMNSHCSNITAPLQRLGVQRLILAVNALLLHEVRVTELFQ